MRVSNLPIAMAIGKQVEEINRSIKVLNDWDYEIVYIPNDEDFDDMTNSKGAHAMDVRANFRFEMIQALEDWRECLLVEAEAL